METMLGQPPAYYHCAERFALEMQSVFAREWLCVGHSGEFAEAGAYKVFEGFGDSIIVVATEAGIRCYSNICRHRGMPLLTGRGTTKALVCPYHAWSYDAATGLVCSAPGMADVRDADDRPAALPAFRCEQWNGWVFVNQDPNASPCSAELGLLDEALAPFHLPEIVPISSYDWTWQANWKLAVENFAESYHLFKVHPRTVQRRTPTNSARMLGGGRRFTLHQLTERPSAQSGLGFNARVPREHRDKEIIACLFPATLLSVTGNLTLCVSVWPETPDRTRLSGTLCLAPHLMDRVDALAPRLKQNLETFMAEDRAIVERLHIGLAQRSASRGPLSPLERSVWEFGRFLQAALSVSGRRQA